MKIRQGFVANSSSYSCVIALGIVKKKDIEKFQKKIKIFNEILPSLEIRTITYKNFRDNFKNWNCMDEEFYEQNWDLFKVEGNINIPFSYNGDYLEISEDHILENLEEDDLIAYLNEDGETVLEGIVDFIFDKEIIEGKKSFVGTVDN